jgi:hypothetical protein
VSSNTLRCSIVYDDEFRSDFAEGLRRDPSTDAMQRGFEELADTLGKLVGRPNDVSLVVAVSLASAVQRRQPGVAYHTDRGTGTVAARTMKRADGRVDVIIESGFLMEVDAYGQGRFTAAGQPQLSRRGLAQMRKTIIHEAQHATMHQRNSGYDRFEVSEHASIYPRWDYAVATKILDEVPIEDLGAPEARLRQAAARVARQWVP